MASYDAIEHVRRKYAGQPCDHCGRTGRVAGFLSRPGDQQHPFRLCHANPDGTKSVPDCYHLVTVHGERLGIRKPVHA